MYDPATGSPRWRWRRHKARLFADIELASQRSQPFEFRLSRGELCRSLRHLYTQVQMRMSKGQRMLNTTLIPPLQKNRFPLTPLEVSVDNHDG